MAIGFVLVSTAAGQEQAVYEAVRGVAGVVEMVPLFGEYDLIVKVEAADWELLGRTILKSIRPIPGVVGTKTLTATRL